MTGESEPLKRTVASFPHPDDILASAIAISLAMFVIDFFKSLRRPEAQALTPYRGSSAGLATDHYLG